MTFLGWKLASGEIVIRYQEDFQDDGSPRYVYPAQHQANDLRAALEYKGRMTPQYSK